MECKPQFMCNVWCCVWCILYILKSLPINHQYSPLRPLDTRYAFIWLDMTRYDSSHIWYWNLTEISLHFTTALALWHRTACWPYSICMSHRVAFCPNSCHFMCHFVCQFVIRNESANYWRSGSKKSCVSYTVRRPKRLYQIPFSIRVSMNYAPSLTIGGAFVFLNYRVILHRRRRLKITFLWPRTGGIKRRKSFMDKYSGAGYSSLSSNFMRYFPVIFPPTFSIVIYCISPNILQGIL